MAKIPAPKRVREPVQVYLEAPDRVLLDRSAALSGLPRAEVLRQGLRQYASMVLADESPALAFLAGAPDASAANELSDVAERHDEYLADWELAQTAAPTPRRSRKKK